MITFTDMARKAKSTSGGVDAWLKWGVPRLVGAGYGLLSRKAISPRWPEFFIVAAVLRKYRNKSSFFFMVRNAIRGMAEEDRDNRELQQILARLVGARPRDLKAMAGIYQALQKEQGTAVAIAYAVETIRILNEKRMHKLSWWRSRKKPQRELAPAPMAPRKRQRATPTKAKHLHRTKRP
ncbi:MAG: hypothetical protein NZL89_01220 [Leptospiraceae bacterium]|nr:hypothetical protein [Leptospiraceae bacterium]